MIRDVLTQMNLFVDGRGFAGVVSELVLPKVTPKFREYKAGGLGSPIDVPTGAIEKMDCQMTLNSYDADVLKLFGVESGRDIQFTARGALTSQDGSVSGVVVSMRGKIKTIDFGTWKPGEDANLKLSMTLTYYKLVMGGAEIIEADPLNMVLSVNGNDQLAAVRAVIGV